MSIESFSGDRKLLLSLFALADDSPRQIASYISLGEVLVAREGDLIRGHLQILETDDAGVFELKSMAVSESHQGRGIGRSLVEAAIVRCHIRGGHRIVVSAATADIGNLRFYQRLGFRMYRIVRDEFSPLRGYPEAKLVDGIPLCDQVFLERDLGS
jgi:ribosomal protein S18 acetylase RimI-like enzyme